MSRESSVWWGQVAGPKNFKHELIEEILNEKSSLLYFGSYTGWVDELREEVQDKVHEDFGLRSFITISADEIGTDLGTYLFQSFCHPEAKSFYSKKKSLPAFLSEEGHSTLGDSFIWITDIMDKKTADTYCQFIAEYMKAPSKGPKGVFILESFSNEKPKLVKGIQQIDWTGRITGYDMAMFAMSLIAGQRMADIMKSYATELASTLCMMDPAICADLAINAKNIVKDPVKEAMAAYNQYNQNMTTESIIQHIWEVQIKVFYPVIERKRLELLNKYHDQIERSLINDAPLGPDVKDSGMVEIGGLRAMINYGYIEMTEQDKRQTELLWTARNLLAHVHTLENFEFMGGAQHNF